MAIFSFVPTPSVVDDQDRIDEPRRLQIEQRAEPAQAAHRAGPRRCPRQRLDRLDKRIAGIDVDPGVGIAQAVDGFAAGVLGTGHVDPRYAKAQYGRKSCRPEHAQHTPGTAARNGPGQRTGNAAGEACSDARRIHAGRHALPPAHPAECHHLRPALHGANGGLVRAGAQARAWRSFCSWPLVCPTHSTAGWHGIMAGAIGGRAA